MSASGCTVLSGGSVCGPAYAGTAVAFVSEPVFNSFVLSKAARDSLASEFGCSSVDSVSTLRFSLSLQCSATAFDSLLSCSSSSVAPALLCQNQCQAAVDSLVSLPQSQCANTLDAFNASTTAHTYCDRFASLVTPSTCWGGTDFEASQNTCGFLDPVHACNLPANKGLSCCINPQPPTPFVPVVSTTSSASALSSPSVSGLGASSPTIGTTNSTITNASQDTNISNKAGIIAGALAATAVVVGLLVVGILLFVKRRRERVQDGADQHPTLVTTGPYTLERVPTARDITDKLDAYIAPAPRPPTRMDDEGGSLVGTDPIRSDTGHPNLGNQLFEATLELIPQDPSYLALHPGDPIVLLQTQGSHHAQAMNANTGAQGLVLLTHLTPSSRDGTPPPAPPTHVVVRAYSATMPDELSLPLGALVQVTHRFEDGWARGTLAGRTGVLPLSCLLAYTDPMPPIPRAEESVDVSKRWSSLQARAPVLSVAPPVRDSIAVTAIDSSRVGSPAVRTVRHAYKARRGDELDVAVGVDVIILKEFKDGWVRASEVHSGREGMLPLVVLSG
ncbi:hypothetical protein BC830DRAFT_1132120 [Chytriomyces sp. MP71]|nr:hypothetical protein BC830DRAFT_1132120 [Chytriomyces sp. MP71]